MICCITIHLVLPIFRGLIRFFCSLKGAADLGISTLPPTLAQLLVDDPNFLKALYHILMNMLKEEFVYKPKVTVDLFATYKFNKKVSIFVGCDNIFNFFGARTNN